MIEIVAVIAVAVGCIELSRSLALVQSPLLGPQPTELRHIRSALHARLARS